MPERPGGRYQISLLRGRCLAEASAPRAERRFENDLDRLRGDRRGHRAEDSDLRDLVLLGRVVPPRQVADLAHVDVRRRALRGLKADRPEEIEPGRDDPGGVPELTLGDLEDR